MATFGITAIGGTAFAGGGTAARVMVNSAARVVAPAGATIVSYHLYGSSPSTAAVMAAYTFNGSVPVNRLAPQTTIALGASLNWYSTTVSEALVNGTTYCLGNIVPGVGQSRIDVAAAGYTSTQAIAALPAVWAQAGTVTTRYSMYATYLIASSVPIFFQHNQMQGFA